MPSEGHRIEMCRRIVAEHRAEEVDGTLLDVQTAHVLTLIWDKLGPFNREVFETRRLDQLAVWAWKQVR